MKRRDFLRHSLIGAGAVGLLPSLLTSCAAHDPLHDFGIISGLVRDAMKEDARGTLSALAEMGYKYIEFGGTFDMEVDELKEYLSEIGLKPLAGGASLANFQGDGLKKAIDDQLALGKKYLVCYWPWMKGADDITWDDVKFSAEECNRIGEICNSAGLRYAFHNHDHEFRTFGGEMPAMDYILQHTDPGLVTMELDLYWITVGGEDPVGFIKRYPGRFELLHIKDSYDISKREEFACVGSGVIDFEEIFRLRETGGFRHLIVERDRGEVPGLECARTSIEHLKQLNF